MFGGIFKKRAGARRLFCDGMRKNILDGHNGPAFGLILDHMQLQDLIDVEPDRKTAKARFRYFLTSGVHESISGKSMQFWEGGLYENQYVREDGIWKFKLLTPHVFWKADYETGWAHSKPHSIQFHSVTYPKDPAGPDALEIAGSLAGHGYPPLPLPASGDGQMGGVSQTSVPGS